MVSSVRATYNERFTNQNYQQFLNEIDRLYPGILSFRVAETPVFVGKEFAAKLINACEKILDVITSPELLPQTDLSLPTPRDTGTPVTGLPQMLCMDFAVCRSDDGELIPQLIEMQGFPTMYAFQAFFPDLLRKYFWIPEGYSHYFSGLDRGSYLRLLQEVVCGDHPPEEVILLEYKPQEQKTLIDFQLTKEYLGVETVCVSELISDQGQLFYTREGKTFPVKRIYNRLIFEEFWEAVRNGDIEIRADLKSALQVEWVPHPDWYYRISKFTLPFIREPFVPETHFLHTLKEWPEDLSQYVLKPLFSFAGQGVKIDVTREDLEAIDRPDQYILQKKVQYAEVIQTPDGMAKTEIRMMYLWKEGEARPVLVTNLARLSKGKMIGVRYNADKEWVGGTVAFFEQGA